MCTNLDVTTTFIKVCILLEKGWRAWEEIYLGMGTNCKFSDHLLFNFSLHPSSLHSAMYFSPLGADFCCSQALDWITSNISAWSEIKNYIGLYDLTSQLSFIWVIVNFFPPPIARGCLAQSGLNKPRWLVKKRMNNLEEKFWDHSRTMS